MSWWLHRSKMRLQRSRWLLSRWDLADPGSNDFLTFLFSNSTAGRPRVMLETASIAGGAVAALFLSFVVGFFVYVRWHQNQKRDMQEDSTLPHQNGETNGHHNAAADVVDGANNGETSCCCQQSQILYSSQLSRLTNTTNGDGLQHPQQQQFLAVPHVHRHTPPKRPFGPHHDHPVSMSEVLLKR